MSDFMMTIITGTESYSVESGRVAVAYRTYADDAQDTICGELWQDSNSGEWTAISTGAFGYISGYPADRLGHSDSMLGAMTLLTEWASELVTDEAAYRASAKALRTI